MKNDQTPDLPEDISEADKKRIKDEFRRDVSFKKKNKNINKMPISKADA